MGTTSALMTVDEFLKLAELDERRVELFQGEVVELPSGEAIHEFVKSNLMAIVIDWLKDHRIGMLFGGTGYRIDEYNFLVPDLSVLSNERIPVPVTEDLLRGTPNLAIEVVSSETAARLRTKIRLYLKHGSKAIWVVYPKERTLEIRGANGQATTLEQDRILEDHDALPGFSTPVSAIFEGL
jgi:Uma2 family endonuclease